MARDRRTMRRVPFAPWFYAIASSRLIDVLRREKRVATREVQSDALPEIAAATEPSDGTIDIEAIHAAVPVAAGPAARRD